MQKTIKTSLPEILRPIEKYLKKVDAEIKSNMITGIPLMDESTSHLFQRGGKKIRASLAILGSGLKGEIPDGVIEMAAAIETVHAAALIHDDIIDQSLLRRGDVTIPKKQGNKIAVLIGDYMYTKAMLLAVNQRELNFYRELVSAACDMIIGEVYQMEYSSIDKISKDHYFKIIEYKTAKFMGICPKVGGIKSGMTVNECDTLYNFGYNLGMAFQIIDDTIDYYSDKEITGKEAGNDFLEGKITLPYLHLLEISGSGGRKRLSGFAKNPDSDSWKIVQRDVRESGSLDYCVKIAGE
ncbi:MAG: polyprenyl synthetase family protein, partial [Spirochaetes bacterium]|nr:polyprenyl synthetase family protein [Spirochaetota bacterium]